MFTGLRGTRRQDPPPARGAQRPWGPCPGAQPALPPRSACHLDCEQQQPPPPPIVTSCRASGICRFRDRPRYPNLMGSSLKFPLGVYLGSPGLLRIPPATDRQAESLPLFQGSLTRESLGLHPSRCNLNGLRRVSLAALPCNHFKLALLCGSGASLNKPLLSTSHDFFLPCSLPLCLQRGICSRSDPLLPQKARACLERGGIRSLLLFLLNVYANFQEQHSRRPKSASAP